MSGLPRSRSRWLADDPLPDPPDRLGRWLALLVALVALLWNPIPWLELAKTQRPLALVHDQVWLRLHGAYVWLYPHALALWGVVIPLALFALVAWLAPWPPTLRPHLALVRWLLRRGLVSESAVLALARRSSGGELLRRALGFERRRALDDWDDCQGGRRGVVCRAVRLVLLDAALHSRRGEGGAALLILLGLVLRRRLDLVGNDVPEVDEETIRARIRDAVGEAGLDGPGRGDMETLLAPTLGEPPPDHALLERLAAPRRALDRRRRRAELAGFRGSPPRAPAPRPAETPQAPPSAPIESPTRRRLWLDASFLAAISWQIPELAMAALESLRAERFLLPSEEPTEPEERAVETAWEARDTALATAFDHRFCAVLLRRRETRSPEVDEALRRGASTLLAEDFALDHDRLAELESSAGSL